jgi:hypothetical protein
VRQPISKFEEKNFGRGDYLGSTPQTSAQMMPASSALAAIGLEI